MYFHGLKTPFNSRTKFLSLWTIKAIYHYTSFARAGGVNLQQHAKEIACIRLSVHFGPRGHPMEFEVENISTFMACPQGPKPLSFTI